MVEVNAMSDACPIPVVKTKKALESLTEAGVIETLVDNETAVQNLLRFANNRGLVAKEKTLGEHAFAVEIEVPASSLGAASDRADETEEMDTTDEAEETERHCHHGGHRGGRCRKLVVVLSSDRMGEGDDALGHLLMKSFVYALGQQDRLPDTLLTYNSGVRLTCEGSPVLEDLQDLKSRGVAIYSCGTCLNFYKLTEKLRVGEVTNMYDIVAMMSDAGRIVQP